MPRLTVGMAHYDDYDGAYFTIQSLRAHNPCDGLEIVVVDNHPRSAHGQHLKNLVDGIGGRYVPAPEAVGTSVPRDLVFRHATAPAVLCLDCHVLLPSVERSSLERLAEYWEANLDSRDMVTGPLLNDALGLYATHFNDQWRAEMWGTWGTAWGCTCGWTFSPLDLPGDGLAYVDLVGQQRVTACPWCDRHLPAIGWAGHERLLAESGFRCLAADPFATFFEIPGMGLGLFSMRRDAWVGFHPEARGFGGEELYVHAKVRAAGGRVLCLPWLRWIHRFGRPGGVRYPISRMTKVRNYVLEFQELGWDLEPIHEHFVASGLVAQSDWDRLVADPRRSNQLVADPRRFGRPQPPAGDHNLDTLYAWCASQPRDLEQHAAKIRELAGQVLRVTGVVKRREWDVFLLAGRPDSLVTYTTERDPLYDALHDVVSRTETNPKAPRRLKTYTVHHVDASPIAAIEDTDLLVLDTVYHGDRLYADLRRLGPRVTKWILISGTEAFGERAEGGQGPGLLPALRRWMREHPEWSVLWHATQHHGLTLIVRDATDE